MARAAERSITLILDPGDELAHLEELRRLHSRPYSLCEPDPTAVRSALALHLLAALGKHPDLRANGSPWPLVEGHLKAERVNDLVLARAHTLTYVGLRQVAEHALGAGARLWLLSSGERPTPAIAQLLEARASDRYTLGELLERWRRCIADAEADGGTLAIPAGGGEGFPWITPCESSRLRNRTSPTTGLSTPDRQRVRGVWIEAGEWIEGWLEKHRTRATKSSQTRSTTSSPGRTAPRSKSRASKPRSRRSTGSASRSTAASSNAT